MRNLKWSDVDMASELHEIKILLSAVMYMDDERQAEREMITGIVDKVLERVCALEAASEREVHHG